MVALGNADILKYFLESAGDIFFPHNLISATCDHREDPLKLTFLLSRHTYIFLSKLRFTPGLGGRPFIA